ncbi:MAG: sigma factor [Nakamurella sp.]
MTGASGWTNSFAEFVQAQTRSLFGTAFLLTGSRDRAEDLLQETLTSLYPKWDKVLSADNQLAYVRRALTNRFLNDVRGSRREMVGWQIPDSWDGVDIAERVVISRTVWQLVGELGSGNERPSCCGTSTGRATTRSRPASNADRVPPAV